MRVRAPHQGDTGQLVSLARAMHRESWFSGFDFDPAKVEALISHACSSENWLPLVLESADGTVCGFFLAAETTHFFGNDRYACDLAVYVTPRMRGGSGFLRMIAAYEDWCRQRGVVEATLGFSTGIREDKTRHLYERMGFAPGAAMFRKKCV